MHPMARRSGLGTSCGLTNYTEQKETMKCFTNISRQWKRCHKTEQGSLPGRLLVALTLCGKASKRKKSARKSEGDKREGQTPAQS